MSRAGMISELAWHGWVSVRECKFCGVPIVRSLLNEKGNLTACPSCGESGGFIPFYDHSILAPSDVLVVGREGELK